MTDKTIITDTRPTFFSAWRPLFGWLCVASLSLQFVAIPVIKIILALDGKHVEIPSIDIAPLIGLVVSILGMGGLRTIEKLSGVQDK